MSADSLYSELSMAKSFELMGSGLLASLTELSLVLESTSHKDWPGSGLEAVKAGAATLGGLRCP